MKDVPSQDNDQLDPPPWSECELFCINGYSGVGGQACGWRGLSRQARRLGNNSTLVCPRCGCTSLFRIPLKPPNAEG